MIRRKIYNELKRSLLKPQITFLTGARQTGKTTLLRQLHEESQKEGKNSQFISLEDPDVLQLINRHPENLFKLFQRPAELRRREKMFVFVDEVQYADKPSNFLKYVYDKYSESLKLVVTGSSAFYLDTKFKDPLTGRIKLFELYTLEFDEFLEFKGARRLVKEWQTMKADKDFMSVNRREIATLFDEYLIYGGYPAVVLEGDFREKLSLLKNLRNSFIKKDISESGVRDELKFFELMKLLAERPGSLVNHNELSNTLRISLATVEHYMYVLRKCYYVHFVNPFFKNLRSEITKMRKVYFEDLGIRNVLINRFQTLQERDDRGLILENYAYIRLRQIYGTDDIRFWRTAAGNEVDFIVLDASKRGGNAYEVKYSYTDFKENKYKKFKRLYPEYPLHLLCYEADNNAESIIRRL